MQRNISDKVFLGQNVSLFDNAGKSDAIDRTASTMMELNKNFKKLENSFPCSKTFSWKNKWKFCQKT